MNLEQMNDRCPKAMVVGTGIVEGYKLTFRGIYKGVANIELCKGRSVSIVLWKIAQDCERALYLYEGYLRLYIKEEVEIKVKGKTKIAMVYVMTSEYTNMAVAPTEYYFNVIAR